MAFIKQVATTSVVSKLTNNFDELNSKSNTIVDVINDEIKPNIQKIENKLNNEIDKSIDNINRIINEELRPSNVEINEVYIPIIIKILLSNLFMFLNRIFKWYEYRIYKLDNRTDDITHCIILSLSESKSLFKTRHKAFKDELKVLKKEYNIDYKTLIHQTILLNKYYHTI